jgi:preprotein translocase subunit SecF
MALFGKKTSFDFLGKRKITTVLSALLIVVSIGSLATRGLNFGIDFTGGVLLEVGYADSADLAAIRARLEAGGFGDALVQNFGTARDVMIRLAPREDVDSGQIGKNILDLLREDDPGVDLRRVEFVGPQVGEELTESGGLAMIFALILISIYIMLRFSSWKFAAGSVAALIHDVIITLGFFSVFQFLFDLSVLAAMLAVIGYSLNDTIVVFDRIRENFRVVRKESTEAIMNISLNQMLGRTIITSVTTLIVLLTLLLLGGATVEGFAIALIVGIFIGTYSSVYTASATALALDIHPSDLLVAKKEAELDDMP